MYRYCIYVFCFLISCFANPVVHKRLDLDGNGETDWCTLDADGTAHCLKSDGSWTIVPPASARATSSAVLVTTSAGRSTPVITQSTKQATTRSPTTLSSSPAVSIRTTSSTTSTKSVLTSAVTTFATTASISKATSSTLFIASNIRTGSLPVPSQFKADNGTKWTISYIGDIQYTDQLAAKDLMGDKCRTGKIGSKIIWNCGDMMCPPDYTVCGFSMGAAMYGTDSVMKINTDGIQYINNNDFLKPWSGDPVPQSPQTGWGMDTSNVAPINDTHGVSYAWEIWRGASDGSYVDRGNAVAAVTLGDKKPIATRIGPLLTDPGAISLGLLAILRDGAYIYLYSIGGPSNIIVSRVRADDSVFDPTKYSTLSYVNTNTWDPIIPSSTNTSNYGMHTTNPGGQFGCAVYGSVFYNSYLRKYVIICNIFMSFTNMYVSDTPWGPWSAEYGLLGNFRSGYGSMAHPEYFEGDGKVMYFSQGPNSKFNVFKVTLGY